MLHEFIDDPEKLAQDNRKLLEVARFISTNVKIN
jgi:hypothetical protein